MGWIAYHIFFLRMFSKIVCRPEILPAMWVQFLERTLKIAKPGHMLKVVRMTGSSSDMVLDASWVDHKGQESWVNAMAGHIRRSIDMTLLEEMKSEAYGAAEDNIDNPQYFLSGQPGASIDEMSELWTCHASVPGWP